MDDVVAQTKEIGYTETIFGRRRPIRASLIQTQGSPAAERQAMNAPIQGLLPIFSKLRWSKLTGRLPT